MITRRSAFLIATLFVLLSVLYYNIDLIRGNISRLPSLSTDNSESSENGLSPISPHVLKYFDNAFSAGTPSPYDFSTLQQQCKHTEWSEDRVYLKCVGMALGLTSIMSQVKVCLKMALETGSGVILPAIALRDSTNLLEYNFLDDSKHLTYDKWFDDQHLIAQLGRACPQMKIIHPDQLGSASVPVKNDWTIDIGKAPGYVHLTSHFWSGRPFKEYFDQQYAALMEGATENASKEGITVVTISSPFLIFRLTDDPTGRDRRLWNDFSHLIRFKETSRKIVDQLLSEIDRPYYGVHFRTESDSIWSSLDNQLKVDLDALDRAWAMYGNGKPDSQKPLIYLACGDQAQVEKFVVAGRERGWEVTHKWQLAQSNPDTLNMINDLPFDFQGAVDMGVMVKSHFFLGITGSAFSSTIANARDVTGRYRGSSFTDFDDENARTHLFNDGDASSYACCL